MSTDIRWWTQIRTRVMREGGKQTLDSSRHRPSLDEAAEKKTIIRCERAHEEEAEFPSAAARAECYKSVIQVWLPSVDSFRTQLGSRSGDWLASLAELTRV